MKSRIHFEVRLEPRDFWIGVFWDKRLDGFHIYFCPVPFLVFHWIFPPKTDNGDPI